MGRSRLLSVLTATVLSVGALSVPATALEVVSDAEGMTTSVTEGADSHVAGTLDETIADPGEETFADPVEDAVKAAEETATAVADNAEEALEDPAGTVERIAEDPAGEAGALLDPVEDALPLPGSSDDDDTGTADDDGVEPAPEPAPASPSTGRGTSPSPAFDHMLTAPAMDHGVAARPSTSRPQVARAPSEAAAGVELAPDVAMRAAAPHSGPLGIPGQTVPALLRALTAMLVAGAMVTWRTVQKELAD